MPRSSYLPACCREQEPQRPEGTDLEIWTWEQESGKRYGIAFYGKSSKPLWHFSFSSEGSRQAQIDSSVESRRQALARKAADKAARKAFKHDLKVGDFLSCSWGYDQTQVDFYEVVAVPSAKSVTIRQVGSQAVSETYHSEHVAPCPGAYRGPALTKRVAPCGSVKIESFARASKWDGKPRYQTAFGQGH